MEHGKPPTKDRSLIRVKRWMETEGPLKETDKEQTRVSST